MKNIFKAYIKAQTEMSNAVKDTQNTFFKSRYADLNAVREAVLPVLNQNGIGVLQPHVNIEGKNFVKTIFVHDSGETMESFTEIVCSKANDPQAFGSAVSYARRYGLQSFACIGAEDDDAEGAMNRNEKKPIQTKTPKEQAQPVAEEKALEEDLEPLRAEYLKYLNHDLITDTEKAGGRLKVAKYNKEQLEAFTLKLKSLIRNRESKQG